MIRSLLNHIWKYCWIKCNYSITAIVGSRFQQRKSYRYYFGSVYIISENMTHLYCDWSFPPTSGDRNFCSKILMILMKSIKFTYKENKYNSDFLFPHSMCSTKKCLSRQTHQLSSGCCVPPARTHQVLHCQIYYLFSASLGLLHSVHLCMATSSSLASKSLWKP